MLTLPSTHTHSAVSSTVEGVTECNITLSELRDRREGVGGRITNSHSCEIGRGYRVFLFCSLPQESALSKGSAKGVMEINDRAVAVRLIEPSLIWGSSSMNVPKSQLTNEHMMTWSIDTYSCKAFETQLVHFVSPRRLLTLFQTGNKGVECQRDQIKEDDFSEGEKKKWET